MKTLDRLILRDHLAPFLGSLATFTVIMLLDRMFQLMDLLIKKGVSIWVVLKVVGFTLPFILSFTSPMAVLVATLVAFGRMAQDSETLALKALGVSIRRAAVGPLVGAGLLAAFLMWFNNTVLPESNHRLKALLYEIGKKKPTAKIRKGVFNQVEDYLIYVEDKNDRTSEIFGVKIQETGNTPRTILAKRGVLWMSGDTTLVLELYDGEIHRAEGPRHESYRRVSFRKYTLKIPVNPELEEKERKFRTDREKPLSLLWRDIKNQRKVVENQRDPRAKRAAKARLGKLWVELNHRFSVPLAALIFILVGVPIAVITKRGGYGTAFGISFFLFVLYYVMMVGGEELAARGHLPPGPASWFPNLVFLALGLYLFVKEERR